MHYAEAVERLYALGAELHTPPGQPRRKFELGAMRALMAALGDPQARFRSVLVAGTNGKGSTSATLANIVAAAGYRTGLYTSPHLLRPNERIQILESAREEASAEIEDERFAELFTQVDRAAHALVQAGTLPQMPSFFEVLTAMAFVHFAASEVDLAVLEVGLGGRLDATNIVEPIISVITDISLDHMEWLGTTVTAIAGEKAGILRENGVMVTLPQHPEANQVLGETAVRLRVRGVNAAAYLPAETPADISHRNHYGVMVDGERVDVDSPLAGEHQQRNLALAIATAIELRNQYSYDIPNHALKAGIAAVRWPGRLERVPATDDSPALLLDVGHNPAGAWALRAALSQQSRPRTLVFGCLRDKPVRELAQILFPVFDRVVLTELESPRTERMESLCAAAEEVGATHIQASGPAAALQIARRATPASGEVVITGSVFLVGAVHALLAQEKERASA